MLAVNEFADGCTLFISIWLNSLRPQASLINSLKIKFSSDMRMIIISVFLTEDEIQHYDRFAAHK